ncbi:MAG: hypothetical protein ACFCUR_17055 [Rhodomicrobiaceae bacterium]
MASKETKSNESKRPVKPSGARGAPSARDITEDDLAQDKMGNNQLQGNDQSNVRNQRHAQPGTKTETDGIIESLEKLDKDVRAKRDLGKGNRS